MVRAFIQARMSSTRFPGKVLAPFASRPLIAHVIDQVAQALPLDHITVATSIEPSDDPLACYVRELGVSVHRGALDNVFMRLRSCLQAYSCTWFFRVCADSPLYNGTLLQTMLGYCDRTDVDLITNVFPRTFPKGQSVEMINAATFAAIDVAQLTSEEREHVTKVYYNHPARFKIINIESEDSRLADTSLAVDTLEDLRRLEKTLARDA